MLLFIKELLLNLLLLFVKLLDGVCRLFDILVGNGTVISETDGEKSLLNWFLEMDIVVQVFLTLFVIAVVLIAVCCIAAIIKSMFHSGDGERKPATKVIGQGLRSLITTVMIAIITFFAIGGANTFLGVVNNTFSTASNGTGVPPVSLARIVLELGVSDGEKVDYTTMEYVRYYQLNGEKSTSSGEVQEDYIKGTVDGEKDLDELLAEKGDIWDDENKVWRWTIMVATGAGGGYVKNGDKDKLAGLFDNDGYLKNDVTVRQIWGHANVTFLWAYSEWWTDGQYIRGNSYNLLLPFFAVIVLTFILVMTSFTLVKRLFDILTLFFVLPVVNACTPIDDGTHMKLWRETMISKVLLAYGAVFAMGVYKIFAPYCANVYIPGEQDNSILTQVLRLLLICGAGLSIQGGMLLFSRLVGTGIAEGNEMGQSARMLLHGGLGAAHLAGNVFRGGVKGAKWGVSAIFGKKGEDGTRQGGFLRFAGNVADKVGNILGGKAYRDKKSSIQTGVKDKLGVVKEKARLLGKKIDENNGLVGILTKPITAPINAAIRNNINGQGSISD